MGRCWLLVVNMEERVRSLGMRAFLDVGKGKKEIFFGVLKGLVRFIF